MANHIGYSVKGIKKAVLQMDSDNAPDNFEIRDTSGATVYHGTFEKGGTVPKWHTGRAYAAIFSDFERDGIYCIAAHIDGLTIASEYFTISGHEPLNHCLPLLIAGLESQHCEGVYNEKDKNVSFYGLRKGSVDLSGGWYDASGDKSKYLSHLTYTSYMMPQQTPMLVWNLLEAAQQMAAVNESTETEIRNRLFDEALYGADFLVRMQDTDGYFYLTVFDGWTGDPDQRSICAYEGIDGNLSEHYQAAFRSGGGMAVAALARISRLQLHGNFDSKTYLEKAVKGFQHLLENSLKYTNDGRENIIDIYCSLMAACELYAAAGEIGYLDYARTKMTQLSALLTDDDHYKAWWSTDQDGCRPYFHAAEAGLPLIALLNFLRVEKDSRFIQTARSAINKAVRHQIDITREINNPFGYARQYVSLPDGSRTSSFFMPHQNESGYWWQGENARISSLAAAFNLAMPYLDRTLKASAELFVSDQINWILGLNPYNICMLDGAGRNNPEYLEPDNQNYRGGVCNGITSGCNDENDIAFMPDPQNSDPLYRWRWAEQWLNNASWLLLAICTSN